MHARLARIGIILTAAVLAGAPEGDWTVISKSTLDGGRSRQLDLGRIERGYATAAAALQSRVEKIEKQNLKLLDQGYDAGLPSARGTSRRRVQLSKPLPARLRGTTIWVVTLDAHGRVHGKPEASVRGNDAILVARAVRIRDALGLGNWSFLSQKGAKALGIRAVPCRIRVRRDGHEIEIVERAVR